MKSIYFERRQNVGHIVLANPPSNLIAADFADSLEEPPCAKPARPISARS
jgi:hypothetical protein